MAGNITFVVEEVIGRCVEKKIKNPTYISVRLVMKKCQVPMIVKAHNIVIKHGRSN